MKILKLIFFLFLFTSFFVFPTVTRAEEKIEIKFDGSKFTPDSVGYDKDAKSVVHYDDILQFTNTGTTSATIKASGSELLPTSITMKPGETQSMTIKNVGEFSFLIEGSSNKGKVKAVAHPSATPAPTATPTNTPAPAATNTPTPSPTVSPTPTEKIKEKSPDALKATTTSGESPFMQQQEVLGAKTTTPESYTLNFKVKDTSGKPVQGVNLTLYSGTDQTESITNIDGNSSFQEVKPGSHLIKAKYMEQSLEQTITVSGADKEINLTLEIKTSGNNGPIILIVLSIIGISFIGGVIFYLVKLRNKTSP